MDLWVVAAAAGAGYLAKFWQNILRDTDSFSELSSGDSNFEKPDSPSCPFRRLAKRKKLGKDVFADKAKVLEGRFSDMSRLDGDSTAEVASTSGSNGEKLGNLSNYENCNVLSISDLPLGFSTNENCRENGNGSTVNGDSVNSGDLLPRPHVGEFGSVDDIMRNRSSLRIKGSYGHYVKPLNSLESCLMAQLYKERAAMEEFVLSSVPSTSTPTTRPLLVTDGSRIISRASSDSFRAWAWLNAEENKLHKEAYSEINETMFGVPPLQKIEPLDLPKKVEVRMGKGRSGRLSCSSKMVNGKHFYSRDGSLLFCLGISIGIISAVIANKREVDKLKELLKQTENLVQDLQEELEMRDSLTVKELANENYESQDTCDSSSSHNRAPNVVSHGQNMNNSTTYAGNEFYDQKAEESSESMSKIEAELEAELERLGLNMNVSSLERRLSELVELDPDFVADFSQGELRADMVGRQTFSQPDTNQDASGTSTTHSANYAVSPQELSLRLHEVIESRLEERIKELEMALQNSRMVQLLELESKNSWREFSNSDLGSSSTQGSPLAKECNSIGQPLVMNLSGEAIDAYNEAYEELMKIDESEEDSPSGVYENKHHNTFDRRMYQGHNAGENGSMRDLTINTDKLSRELIYGNGRTLEEHIARVEGLNCVGCVSGDENSGCDDEMEKILIKQIVEKTKKGSPVVLNAQRVLFSLDENEHYNETKESFAVY